MLHISIPFCSILKYITCCYMWGGVVVVNSVKVLLVARVNINKVHIEQQE